MSDGPTFFQAKIAFTKGFSDRKLTMGKMHQLYQEIYAMKPKILPESPANKAALMSMLLHKGETNVYIDEGMDQLLARYGSNISDLILLSQPKKQKGRRSIKAHSLTVANIPDRRQNYSLSPQLVISEEKEEKSIEVPKRTQKKKKKGLDAVEKLKNTVNRYESISLKISNLANNRLENNRSPRVGEEHGGSKRDSPVMKTEPNDSSAHVKEYMYRIGIRQHNTAIEDYEKFIKVVRKAEQLDPISPIPLEKPYGLFSKVGSSHRVHGGSMELGSSANLVTEQEISPIEVQSPSIIKGISLPKINNNSSHYGLSSPKVVQKKKFVSQDRMSNLFDSCTKVKENMDVIDKKILQSGKTTTRNLAKLQSRLGKVMKVSFLPQEFMLGDDI